MDADDGRTARCGDQPAAGQHLSAPAGRADGGAGLADGPLRRRLRGSVSEPRGSRRRPGGNPPLGRRQRPDAASGQDPCRRLPRGGGRLRLPRLSVRSRPTLGPQEEPETLQGQHTGEDRTIAWGQPDADHRGPEPDAERLVRLLQARLADRVQLARRLRPSAAEGASAQAGKAPRLRSLPPRQPTLAKCLLRERRAVRPSHGLANRERPPMRKPPTGEPYAGKPPVRFGGRGRRQPFPTPIEQCIKQRRWTRRPAAASSRPRPVGRGGDRRRGRGRRRCAGRPPGRRPRIRPWRGGR